jgi:hypothetical protein
LHNLKKREPSIEIEILGKTWRAYLVTKEKVAEVSEDPEDSTAITLCSSREIYFSKPDFSWRVVVHELTHAYLDILTPGSAVEHLTVDAFEEQLCELLEKYHTDLFWHCAHVFGAFKNNTNGNKELKCLKQVLKEISSWE